MICNKLKMCVASIFEGETQPQCSDVQRNICIKSSDKRPYVSCGEQKKTYILGNSMKNHVISYKMDGGVIIEDKTVPFGTNKCDFLFVIRGEERVAILIELKGRNIAHALKQISGVLDLYKDFFATCHGVYVRIIATSSTPNLKASPEYVNLLRKIKSKYNGNIKIFEKKQTEKDTDLSKEI